jgi:uncharacterized protein (TIGR03435 family)
VRIRGPRRARVAYSGTGSGRSDNATASPPGRGVNFVRTLEAESEVIAQVVAPPTNSIPPTASTSPAVPAVELAFEVASIRPHIFAGVGGGRVGISISGSRVTASAMSLNRLVIYAYDLKDDQLSGGPVWAAGGEESSYDIVAKAPGNAPPPVSQVRVMFQRLLADRFQLKIHRETKELAVYELVVGKGGSKLKPHAEDPNVLVPELGKPLVLGENGVASPPPRGGLVMTMLEPGQRRFTATNRGIVTLTSVLSAELNRPVVDNTGLTGTYDYTFQFFTTREGVPLVAPSDDSEFPSVFVAVQEQLGLKLNAAKAPLEIVVVDRVQKPSEN